MSWLQELFDFYSQFHAIFGAFYSRFSVKVYASDTVRSEFNINIETEKRAIFLIGVARILGLEKSYFFVRWLSITNMIAMQTQKRVTNCS